jgi:hypothetical protein
MTIKLSLFIMHKDNMYRLAVYHDLVKGEKDGPEYQRVYYNKLIGVLVKRCARRSVALE